MTTCPKEPKQKPKGAVGLPTPMFAGHTVVTYDPLSRLRQSLGTTQDLSNASEQFPGK